MVIDTFWYHHRDRLPDRSNPGIRSGDTGVLLSFPLFCQRDKKRNQPAFVLILSRFFSAFLFLGYQMTRPLMIIMASTRVEYPTIVLPQTDLPTDFTRKKGCLLYQSLHRRNYRHRRWKRVLHEDNAPSPLAVGRI